MERAQSPCTLVTGAGRGLGRAIANAFHAKRHTVIATDFDEGLLADLEGAERFITARQDVGSVEDAARIAELIRERCGRLDVVVNNAGINPFYPVTEAPPERTIQAFRINTFGALIVTHACLDLLEESKGRVVNIASESSTMRPPFQVYQATKMSLEALSDTMRRELAFLGIHLAFIRPGAIQTNLIEETKKVEVDLEGSRYAAYFPKLREMVVKGLPKKVSRPEEVAAVVYLAATDPKRKVMYRINNDPKQRVAALLPLKWVDRLILRILQP